MAPRGRRMMSDEEKWSIDEKKRQGMSVKELAKLFKRSSQTISRALKEIGAMSAAQSTTQQLFPQVMPSAVYDSLHASILEFPPAPSNALSTTSAPVLSAAAGDRSEAARRRSAARAVQPRHAQTNPSDLPPQQQQQQRIQRQQPSPLQNQVDVDGRRECEPAPPSLGEAAGKISAPAMSIMMSSLATPETTQAAQPQPVQTNLPVVAPMPRQRVRTQSLPLQGPAGASRRQIGPTPLVPPAFVTPDTATSTKDPAAAMGMQGETKSIANAAQPPSAPKPSPPLPPPKQTSSAPPPQMLRQPAAVPMSVGSTGNRRESTTTAPPGISKPTIGTTSATSTVTIPGIIAAGASTALIGRRPITRPPRVFALTRPASMQKETKGRACNGSQDQGATAKTAAAKSNATSTQRVARKAETMASPDSDLMSLLLGMVPEDDTSPQTSQDDESAISQVGSLSQTSNTSSKGEASACLSQVSLISQQSTNATATPSRKPSCGIQAKHRQDVEAKKCDLQLFLSSLQDQVENLQPDHIGDETSKVYQLLTKFRDEFEVLSLSTTPQFSERERKRKRDEDADNMALGKLLHEKMAAEVALVNIQVQRERAQLDRERMKTEVEAALSRKKLEDASIPKSAIDSIFANTIAN